MNISQKCQYAVRSVLELAKRYGSGPIAIGEIAAKQAIPPRFLEIILNELKGGGFVQSRRGVQGGYLLAKPPQEIAVGEIIRFVEGPLEPVKCMSQKKPSCPLSGQCALIGLWKRAKEAVEGVYDSCSFQDLAEQEAAMDTANIGDFSI
jgi:Rrf2 family protein